jgi:GTP pyrophosphokinase
LNQDSIDIKAPLRKLLARVPPESHPIVGQAYHIAFASHEGQRRDAGQPFIIHPIDVAVLLASELGFSRDAEMMTAALLHDAVEDSALDFADIEPAFGSGVATLVRGVTKTEDVRAKNRSARRNATLQKLFSAAQEDPRVLILKLADRVHNMRSIDGIADPVRRERIAQETVDVYIPIAHLLGMRRTRRELENQSLSCMRPDIHAELTQRLSTGPSPHYGIFAQKIIDVLHTEDVRVRTRIQPKSMWSMSRKLERQNVPLVNIYNRHAIEVIVSSRDTCYRALGILHGQFPPVMETIKDFIALPKRNRYQALHTTVLDGGNRYEVHIQTPAMHRVGELGVAALKGNKAAEESRRKWLTELSDWHDHDTPSHHLLDDLKRILFVREIAAFTPEDEPYILPEGSTALDFAFAVHSDLGLHCSGAIVNGKSESPFATLKWGDTVHIETDSSREPKPHWLRNLKSYHARKAVKRYLHISTDETD